MSLKETIESLRGQMREAFEFDDTLEGITTGSIAVDLVTGIGGFPRKRVTEVSGWESSGKTTLCLQSCASAQAEGLIPAYIDMERGVDLSLAKRIGYDYENHRKGVFLTPMTFENAVVAVHELALSGDVDIIFLDSVPAMVPQSEAEGKITDLGAIANRARLLAAFLPRITKTLVEQNVALVLVNQMRYHIATSKFDRTPPEQTSGGTALRFYSALRLSMDLITRGLIKRKIVNQLNGKEEEVPVANLHRCQAFKSKIANPYRRAEFIIRYDPVANTWGIDNLKTLIDLAVARGIIEQKGGYFVLVGDDPKVRLQGFDATHAYLREHVDRLVRLREQLGV